MLIPHTFRGKLKNSKVVVYNVKLRRPPETDLATKEDIATLSLKLNGLYALYALQMAWLSWLSLKLVDMSATLAVVAELAKK